MMTPSSGMRVVGRISLLLSLIFLSHVCRANGDTFARPVDLSDEQRIRLVFLALEKAINEPGPFTFDRLAPTIADNHREEVRSLIEQLTLSKTRIQLSMGLIPILGESKSSDNIDVAKVKVALLPGSSTSIEGDTVEVRFRRYRHFFQFEDIRTLLQEVNSFMAAASQRAETRGHAPRNSMASSLGAKDVFSDELLIPYPVLQGLSRFTATESRDQFHGKVILNRPSDVLALSLRYLPDWEWMNREFLISTEDNFNKLTVYGSRKNTSDDPWIRDFCSYCTSIHDFGRLKAVAWVDNLWLVAEGSDGIVKGLSYDGFWDFTDVFTIDDSLGSVSDIAAARIPMNDDPGDDISYIAVAYPEQSEIGIYETDGDPVKIILGPGSGFDQIGYPSSICFARNWVTNQKMPYLYALDDVNKRVIIKGLFAPYAFLTSESAYQFSPKSWLVSITTDAFGSVYVLDESESRIYMFTGTLDTLLATYGSGGTGDKQLYYPKSITAAEMWSEVDQSGRMEPGIIGNVLAAELVTNSTGVRSFLFGGHISVHDTYYVPMYTEG